MRNLRVYPTPLIASAVISALALVLSPVSAQAKQASLSSASSPAAATSGTHKVLFGGTSPLLSAQPKIGHLGIVRLYWRLGEPFGGREMDRILGSGTTALVSLDDPRNGPSYASITAGQHDTEIRTFLTQVEQAAVHAKLSAIYVAFEHEANAPWHRAHGTPAQFAAAYDHIHALGARAKLNWNTGGRLHWALILEHLAYFPASQRPRWSYKLGFAQDYWPGKAVDVVAADGYNSSTCYMTHDSHPPQQTSTVAPSFLFNPVLAFARSHGGLPVFIAEWASIAYTSPLIRPKFIHAMQQYVESNPSIRAAMYWDSPTLGGQRSPACSFNVNHAQPSLTALAAMNRALGVVPNHAPPPPPRHKRHHSRVTTALSVSGDRARTRTRTALSVPVHHTPRAVSAMTAVTTMMPTTGPGVLLGSVAFRLTGI